MAGFSFVPRGEGGYTKNLYFDSTGRNEIIVLDNLLKYEKSSKSSPAQ